MKRVWVQGLVGELRFHKQCSTAKIFWRMKWQPMPVFLPGKFHGQRSLTDYSPWGHGVTGLDTREHTCTHTCIRLSEDLKSRPDRTSAFHNQTSENLKAVACQCHMESKVAKASRGHGFCLIREPIDIHRKSTVLQILVLWNYCQVRL